VPVNSSVVVTFNETVNPLAVTTGTVKVSVSGAAVAGSYTVNGAVVTFTPLTPLPGNVSVSVSVSGVTDLAGNGNAGFGSRIYNSIINATIAFGLSANYTGVAYSDLWPLADGLTDFWRNGGQVVSFDPEFVGTGPLPYKLDFTSLFTDFSVSGGQIGAYGPGPGPPPASVSDENEKAPSLRVAPNPSTDGRVTIAFSVLGVGNLLLEAFDVSGRRVWSESFQGLMPGDHSAVVGTPLPRGIYWLRLSGDGRSIQRRAALAHCETGWFCRALVLDQQPPPHSMGERFDRLTE